MNADSASNPVQYWIQSPEIEVGKGYVYNTKLGDSWVTELDPRKNSCIKQKVPLQAGKALLEFDYAGRVGTKAKSEEFSVKLNGVLVAPLFKPSDDVLPADI